MRCRGTGIWTDEGWKSKSCQVTRVESNSCFEATSKTRKRRMILAVCEVWASEVRTCDTDGVGEASEKHTPRRCAAVT